MTSREIKAGRETQSERRVLSACFRALADDTRLRILRALAHRRAVGATVTELCEELRVSQPLMSWHLRILRRAGLITTERSGRQVHCVIDTTAAAEYGTALAQFLRTGPESDFDTAGERSSYDPATTPTIRSTNTTLTHTGRQPT